MITVPKISFQISSQVLQKIKCGQKYYSVLAGEVLWLLSIYKENLLIAECQRELLEARVMVEKAEFSLSLDADEVGDGDVFVESGIDKDRERWESVKTASISVIVGSLAGLPISCTQVSSSAELILPLGFTFISCALFGVTF